MPEAQVNPRAMTRPARQVVWLAAVVLLNSASAWGQTPACGPESVGQLSEQAGVRCECVAEAGGSITGRASGYRWDCGILRGRMNQLIPANPNAYQGPLPESIIVDPAQVPFEPLEPRTPWPVPRHHGPR